MRLFGKSALQKLRDKINQLPDAAKEMNADEIKTYLLESLALSKKVDGAMVDGTMDTDLGERLKNSLLIKGLSNTSIGYVVKNQLLGKHKNPVSDH